MATEKVSKEVSMQRKVNNGDAINKKLVEKQQRRSSELLIKKLLDEEETKVKAKKETPKDEENESF